MFKLVYFVPESHLEATKSALFSAGAGQLQGYSHCCWQVKGMGQFMPSLISNPTIGQAEQLTQLEEYRVELLVAPSLIQSVVQALKIAHPYEVPAFEVIRLEEFN